MRYQGVLNKMQTQYESPVQYYLVFRNDFLNLNQLLGKTLTFHHEGYECLSCGASKKIFRQGFCYDCFMDSPAAGHWIMRPELSKAHLDIEDRDLNYEKKVQLQPHIVYLAFSSDIKVGVTRKTQVPTRWIDQGAIKALPIVEVPNRYLAGIAEVALKNHFADKTNWRKMLQNQEPNIDFNEVLQKSSTLLPEEVMPYYEQTQHGIYEIHYPVVRYPEKIKSLSLEKTPEFSGVLSGIKGQYLLFEDGTVFNIRNSEGFVTSISIN